MTMYEHYTAPSFTGTEFKHAVHYCGSACSTPNSTENKTILTGLSYSQVQYMKGKRIWQHVVTAKQKLAIYTRRITACSARTHAQLLDSETANSTASSWTGYRLHVTSSQF